MSDVKAHTEPTSNAPPGPSGPGGGVVKALQHLAGGVDGIAAGQDIGTSSLVHHDSVVVVFLFVVIVFITTVT